MPIVPHRSSSSLRNQTKIVLVNENNDVLVELIRMLRSAAGCQNYASFKSFAPNLFPCIRAYTVRMWSEVLTQNQLSRARG